MSVGARGAQGSAKHSTAEKVARASRATVMSAIQVWEREEGSVWCGNGRCWCLVPCPLCREQEVGQGSRGEGSRGSLAWTASWVVGQLHFPFQGGGQV